VIQGIRAATFAPQRISLVLEEYDESHTSEISKPLLIIPPSLSYHPPSSPWRSMSLRDGFSSPAWRLKRADCNSFPSCSSKNRLDAPGNYDGRRSERDAASPVGDRVIERWPVMSIVLKRARSCGMPRPVHRVGYCGEGTVS